MDIEPFMADTSQAGQYIKMNNLEVQSKRRQGQIGTVGKSQNGDVIRNIYEGFLCGVYCNKMLHGQIRECTIHNKIQTETFSGQQYAVGHSELPLGGDISVSNTYRSSKHLTYTYCSMPHNPNPYNSNDS